LTGLYAETFGNASHSPFGSTYAPELLVQQTKKTKDSGFVSVDFLSANKEEDEDYNTLMQQAVLNKLLELSEKEIPAHEICILARYNKDIIALAEYLASLKTDYPQLETQQYLHLVSNEAFQLHSSMALKIIIEALKCLADPGNSVSRAQLDYFAGQLKNSGEEMLPSQLLLKESDSIALPLTEQIAFLYRFFHLNQIAGQSAYLFTFYDALTAYLNDRSPDLPSFLMYWEEELQYKTVVNSAGIAGVRAMTIHKSKGLQFHTVVIPFCDWEINPRTGSTVWCGAKPGFYDIKLLPVAYSKAMGDTIFAEEYEAETAQTWMDNLNVLYVALTRAKQNLIILSKENEKLADNSGISSIADLLQLNVSEANGVWKAESRIFRKGQLEFYKDFKVLNEEETIALATERKEDNPLKQFPPAFPVEFASYDFKPGVSIFKQSNQSREFTHPELPSKERYVAYGNVMHRLFEHIRTLEDIESAVINFVSEGFIPQEEKSIYVEKIRSAITESQVEDWFSGKAQIYQEAAILWEEDGELQQKRPDRVLISPGETLVIDFKFGEAHPAHHKQVQHYVSLLEKMGYADVQGYLWYVEKRQIVSTISPSF
jgi:ATP-dependent exoDNAse (exonuclease V) beta subunit